MEERKIVEEKKNKINEAARKADEPVDDSKLVEAMFDFLPDSSSEAPTPGGKYSIYLHKKGIPTVTLQGVKHQSSMIYRLNHLKTKL